MEKKRIIEFVLIGLLALILAIDFAFQIGLGPSAQAVLGTIGVLFLPGLCLTFGFFEEKEIDWLERIALSIGLSIATVPLILYIGNKFLGIPVNFGSCIGAISIVCLIGIGIWYGRKKNWFERIRISKKAKGKKK